jgi:hypothetical protein
MNPNIEDYEKTLKTRRFRPIAMSILASGAVNPDKAVNFVCRKLNIQSVVFGASRKQHIMETKQIIEKYR